LNHGVTQGLLIELSSSLTIARRQATALSQVRAVQITCIGGRVRILIDSTAGARHGKVKSE